MESTALNPRNPNRALSSIVKPPPQIGINIDAAHPTRKNDLEI